MTLNDTAQTVLEADFILYAAGRSANIKELNLSNTGVQLDKHGFIAVDEEQKTNIGNVFALGDVTSRPQLTPLAIKTGRTWAEYTQGGRKDCVTDFDSVPTVVFSHPPLATIGLLEVQAKKKYGEENISVYTSEFNNLFETLEADKSKREKSLQKLICLKSEQDKILGAQLIGRGSDEVMQTLAVAIKMGARKRDMDQTLAIHPTASEELVLMDPKIWGSEEMK